MTDPRMCLIYEVDGQPVREDATLREFMKPCSDGRPRLIALLERFHQEEQSFSLMPSREVFPADWSTGQIPAVNP